jgi:hypothetical protein
MNSFVNDNYSFSVGIGNIVEANSAMAIGEYNKIDAPDSRWGDIRFVGARNTFSSTVGAHSQSFISGFYNTITESSSNVFVLGSNSIVDRSPNTLIFGADNSTTNQITESVNHLSILIGKGNTIDNGFDNILIGRNNIPNGATTINTIAIGTSNHPSPHSIYIGQDNNSNVSDGNFIMNASTKDNIVIGRGINFKNDWNRSEPMDSNVLIGHNFDVTSSRNAQHVSATLFSARNTIGIGNNIFPMGGGSGSGLGYNSISIGNDIGITSENSINIGNKITSGRSPALGIQASPNGINIGNNIVNTYDLFGWRLGPASSYGPRAGAIIIGNPNSAAYPNTFGGGGTGNAPRPALVIAPNAGPTEHANYNLLYMDKYANLFIGLKTGGFINSGDNFVNATNLTTGNASSGLGDDWLSDQGAGNFGGARVYARAFYAMGQTTGPAGVFSGNITMNGLLVQTSDQNFKSNIKPLSSGMEDYLNRIQPFSYTMIKDETQRLQWGFMAQDVQQFFPHLVYEIEVMDSSGEVDGLGLNYIGFIPVLWKINQAQQTQIDSQQKRIQALERQVKFINDFNADELRRQERRIAELERKLEAVLQQLTN